MAVVLENATAPVKKWLLSEVEATMLEKLNQRESVGKGEIRSSGSFEIAQRNKGRFE